MNRNHNPFNLDLDWNCNKQTTIYLAVFSSIYSAELYMHSPLNLSSLKFWVALTTYRSNIIRVHSDITAI